MSAADGAAPRVECDEAPPLTDAQWLARWNARESRRRAKVLRAHGHAVTPYPTPGCARCVERVRPWGER